MEKGIIYNLSNADYHADLTHLSSSNLKLLLGDAEDRQKFYEDRILKLPKAKDNKSAFDFGSLLHTLILEPVKIADEFAFYKGCEKTDKEGKTYTQYMKRGPQWEFFKERNPDKIILTTEELKKAEELLKCFKANTTAVELINGIKPEVSLFTDLSGVPVKVRADGLCIEKGYILDIKTTGFDTDCETFKVTMERWGYKLSAALYLQAFESYLKSKMDFYFIVIGKENLCCEVFKLGQKSRDEGSENVTKALSIYKNCLETGDWIGDSADTVQKEYANYEILEV